MKSLHNNEWGIRNTLSLVEGEDRRVFSHVFISRLCGSLSAPLACLPAAQEELFEAVYPLFKARGLQAALLRRLEGPILRDLMPTLQPEPLQDLVEFFVAEGEPERVERCVLHLNVVTMDLNQFLAHSFCCQFKTLRCVADECLAVYVPTKGSKVACVCM
eukprot:scaffold463206_cov24-Prasinocladus_malaysianus.AAC.1